MKLLEGKISYIWPWKFLNIWDDWWAKFFGIPLKKLNKIFGRDNFFFSEMVLFLGGGTIVSFYTIRIVTASGFPWLWSYILLIWAWLSYVIWNNIQTLKPLPGRVGPELQVTKEEYSAIKYLCTWRVFWLLLEFVMLPFTILDGPTLGDFGFIFIVIALYWATDFLPPGKSVFARAKEKILSWAGSFHPLPLPVPLPARS